LSASKRPLSNRPVNRASGRRYPSGSSHRRYSSRRSHLPVIALVALGGFGAILILFVWAIAARAFTPKFNTARQSFDAIIVLGTPADSDSNPTPALLDRVSEGVREYQRGVAPHLIFTGAAAHNQFVEAEVMARVAEAQGVPASVVFTEPRALDTIQNACYSSRILKEHHWHSAEVISSASHLPRAAMILTRLAASSPFGVSGPNLEWRVHAAPDGLTPGYYNAAAQVMEIFKTARYLAWAQWAENCNS
jgi:uncharacterized SAM-binding protein YcdF (DUF218 family)